MNWFTAAWIVWLLAFAAIEGIAVFNRRKDDTLSEHVWLWFGIKPNPEDPKKAPTTWVWIRRGTLLVFVLWLGIHFMTGGLI